jgi:hypothetical protein
MFELIVGPAAPAVAASKAIKRINRFVIVGLTR